MRECTIAEKEIGLTPEPHVIFNITVFTNTKDKAVEEPASTISGAGATDIPTIKACVERAFPLKMGRFDTKNIRTQDGLEGVFVKISINQISDVLLNTLRQIQRLLEAELNPRPGIRTEEEMKSGMFLQNKSSHREVFQKMLSDRGGIAVHNLNNGDFTSWEEWLDWIWFEYKPKHELTETDSIIIQITQISEDIEALIRVPKMPWEA